MKNFILAVSLFALSFNSVANETQFYCKQDFEKKLERIERNYIVRNLPRLPLAAGGIYLTGASLLALGVTGISGGLALFFVGPWALQPIISILDREPGLKDALSALSNANLKESEVLPHLRKKIQEERERLANDPEMVQEALAYENRNRAFNGLPPLTADELIEMVLNAPLPNERPSNGIDTILKKLNKKLSRREMNQMSYEEVRQLVLAESQTDFFCPNGRPITSKQAARRMFRQIKRAL